ncbi:unnamed protein product [Closterium sp. NIES-64]|nr:unnamed protein product [Closterium sp. NIES-64]
MFFMLGLLLDDTFNHVIKHALEMPRPPHTCAALEVCDSHGMPSAHSQFMSFFATFATWLVFYKMDYEDERWRWITAVLPWPFTFLTMASRVYLGYHTIPQVLAGFTLGILSASFWFYVVHRVFAPFFPTISDSVWGRYLCIKDDCHIRNVAVFEYLNSQRAREEQRAREKAQNAEQEKLLEKSQEKTQEKVQQGKEEEVDEQQGGKQQQSAEETTEKLRAQEKPEREGEQKSLTAEQDKLLGKVQQGKEDRGGWAAAGGKEQQAAEESMRDGSANME